MPPETLGFLGRAAGGFARGQEFMRRLKQQQEETKLRKALIDAQVGLTELKTAELLQKLSRPQGNLFAQFQQLLGGAGQRQAPVGEQRGGPFQGVPPGQTGQPGSGGIFGGFDVEPSLSISGEGKQRLTLKASRIQPQITFKEVDLGNGQSTVVRIATNPQTGQSQVQPVALAAPTPQMRQAFQILQGFGVSPDHPQFDTLLRLTITALNLPESLRPDALAEVEELAAGSTTQGQEQGRRQRGQPPPPGLSEPSPAQLSVERPSAGFVRTAQQRKEVRELQEEIRKTEEKNLANLRTKPLPAAVAEKVRLLLTAEQQAKNVQRLFRPEFVGRGLQPFLAEMNAQVKQFTQAAQRGEYVPGAIAGALREFTGRISPEEAEFRAAVLDVADIILRARSGAQINEDEFRRLKGLLFRLTDEPNAFVPRFLRVQKQIAQDINNALELATSPAGKILEKRQRPQILNIRPGAPIQ